MEPAYFYKAVTQRVVDGDTYHLVVDLGFHVATMVPARLHGVDAPELKTEAGKIARAYAISLLLPMEGATPLVIQSFKDEQSFARWVVNIWLPGDVSLAGKLLESGHAVPLNIG